MKEIFREYGKVIIVGMIVGMMLFLFFSFHFYEKKGIPQIAGALADTEDNRSVNNQEIQAMESYCKGENTINCQIRNAIVAAPMKINEMFLAENEKQNIYKIIMVRTQDNKNAIKEKKVALDREYITFLKKGVYTITVKTKGSKAVMRDFVVAVGR